MWYDMNLRIKGDSMSKNIVIEEGGIGKQLTADKLKTNLVGVGTCLWVPEDEVILGTKSIIHNGTYSASADGLTGFSQVNVNVQGDSVTGRDPVTGQEKTVTVDPETGDLVETVVPSEIRVITPPTNPYGTYIDGQTITKDGMVVKAYDANGVEMQVVPNGQLTIDPTVAVFDESKDRKLSYTAESDLVTSMQQPISFIANASYIYISGIYETRYYKDTPAIACCFEGGTSHREISASANPPALHSYTEQYRNGVYQSTINDHSYSGTPYTHDGKTVYYYSVLTAPTPEYNIPENSYNNNAHIAETAWTMIYGDITTIPAGSPQTITVSWPRPGDGKLLETTFDINVGPRAGQGDD